jgi:CMP/dCMP kinase
MTEDARRTGDRPRWLVVIDGPAGAGKTTIARRVAAHLGVPLLDTGAIYRALAWWARERGVAWDDEPRLRELARELPIRFSQGHAESEHTEPRDEESQGIQSVWIGETDVTGAIRTPEMSEGASQVSALPAVREALLAIQRAVGAKGCVAEGRDMGTVVFPDAPHKFFLTADLSARAARRRLDLAASAPKGVGPSLREVEAAIQTRDARDSSRAVAPLRAADDAIVVDSTGLDADGVFAVILGHLRSGVG